MNAEDARLYTDVYLRPYFVQPFDVGPAEQVDDWWTVAFTYGPDTTPARSQVMSPTGPVRVYGGPSPSSPSLQSLRSEGNWSDPT